MTETAWRREARQEVAVSDRATVYADTYRLPDGSQRANYLVVEERGGALIVALTDADEVLLVGQYRAPIGAFVWELPAGTLEPGEADPAQRARAELRQETGYAAREWHDAGTISVAPHRSNETDQCYLALGVFRAGDQDTDPGESVEVRLVSLPDVERMIEAGEIRSAPSIAALHKALRVREKPAAAI